MENKKIISYESVLVLVPDLQKPDQQQFIRKLHKTIQQFQGKMYHIDSWGVRRLANRNRKKYRQGLYFHFSFSAQAGVVAELVRQIRIDKCVIYHHFERLPSKISLEKNLDTFRQIVSDSIKAEKEHLARIQQNRKNFTARRGAGA